MNLTSLTSSLSMEKIAKYIMIGSIAFVVIFGVISSLVSTPSSSRELGAVNKAEIHTASIEKFDKLIQDQFSVWDGSHFMLKRHVKNHMNDSKSYEHVESTYIAGPDRLVVFMKFRGSNAFGGIVMQEVTANVDLKTGEVLSIVNIK